MEQEVDALTGLSTFVEALRTELQLAREASSGSDMSFEVDSVEVEFNVVTTREAGPQAKVRFWVIEAGGSAKFGHAETQRLKLSLTPVSTAGEPVHISDPTAGRPR